jgi:hypothetical protein
LISEKVQRENTEVTILFSLRNATDNVQVTVYDIVINALVFEEVGVAHSGDHRIDLGVAAIFDAYPPRTGTLQGSPVPQGPKITSLLGNDIVVTLAPKESESFKFRLLKPETAHNLHVVFSISALYHDDQGRRRISYSDRIYRVIVDDQQGFTLGEAIDWNADALADLEQQYLSLIYSPQR